MKKIKDFLKTLNEILKIPEIDGWVAAENLMDVEISDSEAVEEAVKGLLTFDAAKNNNKLKAHFKEQIYNAAKGEMLGVVDSQIVNTTRDLFGDEAANEIEAIEFTKDKIKKFSELSFDDRGNNADDKSKKTIESLRKQLEKNQQTYEHKLDEKEGQIKKLTTGYEGKLVNSEIKRRINSKQFAEKYSEEDLKDVLSQTAINRITKEATIKLNNEGEAVVYNPEDPEMELYMDGKKATLDNLIDKHIGKYLAKSEPKRTETKFVQGENGSKQNIHQTDKVSSLAKAMATRRGEQIP